MKKFAILLLVGLFFVVGCGKNNNKVVCKATTTEEGKTIKAEVVATLKNEKVSDVSATMVFDDESTAQAFCGLYGLANQYAEKETDKIDINCKGKTVKIKNFAKILDSEENSIIGLSKDEFIKQVETEDSFSCK